MAKKSKVINVDDMPSSFRGVRTSNGSYTMTGIPPIGGVYDKVAKSAGLVKLANEFLYNGINSIIPNKRRTKLIDDTVGRTINSIKEYNDQTSKDDDLGPTFPFNIITTPRTNGKNMPQKQYAAGGKVPNVVDGGVAKPIGNNLFYMSGRKHNQGGIDIGPSDKTGIEVEDGEVVETKGNELKVYSAQPILNGTSPAQLVMGGVNPNKVFNAQENYKDRNRINDDGTKYKKGGRVYQAPDEYKRQIAENGSVTIGGNPPIAGNRTYGYVKSLAKANKIGRIATNAINLGRQKVYNLTDKINNTYINQGIKEIYRSVIGKDGKNLPRTVDYVTNRKQEKFGGRNMIVSISGNVKNGLMHNTTSTGRRNDKLKSGGTRKTKTNDLENNRPQYYAERDLPLFDNSAGIVSGLVRPGWSHGINNNKINNINTDISSLPPRRGSTTRKTGTKSTAKTNNNTSSKQPTKAVYNRNLPKVEASIPNKISVNTTADLKDDKGRGIGTFKNLTTADWIGLGSNIAGSIGSYIATNRGIRKAKGPNTPTLTSASKLKTRYNINPQLDKVREDKFEAYRDIDSNTASSRVGLARKQRVRNAAGQTVNQLYGNKENIETELINKDRLNQQGVRQLNAQQYNQYLDRRTAFNNSINDARMGNINNLFTGINAGIQDMIGRYENRKALNNTVGAMRAAAPNVDDRIMRDAGVDYDEFMIRKRRKLGGR